MSDGKWIKKDGHWQYQGTEGGGPLSGADLFDLRSPDAESGDYWGDWVYDAQKRILTYQPQRIDYPIRLGELNKARNVIDWVNQLHGKNWMNPRALGDFLYALFDLHILPTKDTFSRD